MIESILDEQFGGNMEATVSWVCSRCGQQVGHITEGRVYNSDGVEVQSVICGKCGVITTPPLEKYQENMEHPDNSDYAAIDSDTAKKIITKALLQEAFDYAYEEINVKPLPFNEHWKRFVSRTEEIVLEFFPDEKIKEATKEEFNQGGWADVRRMVFDKTLK